MHLPPAAGAALIGKVQHMLHPLKMRRQGTAIALTWLCRARCRRAVSRWVIRWRRRRVLAKDQRQLRGINPFSALPKARTPTALAPKQILEGVLSRALSVTMSSTTSASASPERRKWHDQCCPTQGRDETAVTKIALRPRVMSDEPARLNCGADHISTMKMP